MKTNNINKFQNQLLNMILRNCFKKITNTFFLMQTRKLYTLPINLSFKGWGATAAISLSNNFLAAL